MMGEIRGMKTLRYHLALQRAEAEPARHAGDERDAQVDEHALRDLADGDADCGAPEAEPTWSTR